VAVNTEEKQTQETVMFNNMELDSIYKRTLGMLESLANIGKYYHGLGVAHKLAVQTAVRREISKEEFADALYAMEHFAKIGGEKLKNPIYDEHKDTIIKNLKVNTKEKWTKRLWKFLAIPLRKLTLLFRLRKK
jgi:hypothetical protein